MGRRYLAEFLGTLVIVFVPVAIASTGQMSGGDSSLMAAAIASGLPVLAMVCALGPISAAHFNPAITLGFAMAGRFPWRNVIPYWLAQFLGAISAGALAYGLFGGGAGAHVPADSSAAFRNLGMEFMISFILMLVIIAVATDRRVKGSVPALSIGAAVTFGVLIAGPVTGGSMNPARSLGPALFSPAALPAYWIYLLGPCLGCVAAALVYERVRLDASQATSVPPDLEETIVTE